MKNPLLIVIVSYIFIGISINVLLEDPSFESIEEEISFAELTSQYERNKQLYSELILKDSLNIDYHRGFIQAHFNQPEKKFIRRYHYEYREDFPIYEYYYELKNSSNQSIKDIANYCLGLYSSNTEAYSAAISFYNSVSNKKLKYLNNSLGYCYLQIDSIEKAENCFRREIKLKGNIDGSYRNLIGLLSKLNRIGEIEKYLKNPETSNFVPYNIEREIYFINIELFNYILTLFAPFYYGFSFIGFLGAFLVMGSWTMYLYKLDLYEKELWKHISIVLCLGMVFSFATFFLSDFIQLILGFTLNGEVVNDFFYSVITIGGVEELVKIIPLLLLLKYTEIINEPYDYILYASLSALGFAFIENLLYLGDNNINILHGRGLAAAVGHMFNSSIIAFGLLKNKLNPKRSPVLNFVMYFTLASLAHGFWDFWLINEKASSYQFMTYILLLFSIFIWNSFKNNALNQTNFYNEGKSNDMKKLSDYLLYSLSAILMFEYVSISLLHGPSVGNNAAFGSLKAGSFLIFFHSTYLGQFQPKKGEWVRIKFWGLNKPDEEITK